ncbi:MAG TPA: cytochrome b/b6 domain-containing protein [Terriglobales bacterium]|nr:cytochrome b/b6 domain-containing protein [Terriglobales bacterium]
MIMRNLKVVFLICLLLGSALAANKKAESAADKSAECLACHSDATLIKEENGKQINLHIDEEHFKASIHGSMFTCLDCHKDVKGFPHDPAPAKVDCAACHEQEVKDYNSSLHAIARQNGDLKAATCLDCHGDIHEVLPSSDPNSRVSHTNIPKTCGSCHGQKFVMESAGLSSAPFVSYQDSVHGKAVAAGSEKAAVCTDCHGAHNILPAGDSKSSIFKFNVPATCGKCHENVKQQFMSSIHGQAIAKGSWQAPVCTDCHGIHGIKSHLDPNSSVSAQALAATTCARCHEGVRLTQDFGIEAHRASTYLSSYHGLASQMGSKVVANCASCHGAHNILPSSDPRSTINQANLITTCGKCHPGASQKFVLGKIHVDAPLSSDRGSIAIRWVRRFYLVMIFGVIGGMLLHNFLIWRKKALEQLKSAHRIVVRMDSTQRMQHLLLLISFITLVVTGFALKYPESVLGMAFVNETVRSVIHRSAGTLLILVSLYHVGYVAAVRSGRQFLFDMLPEAKDARDVIQNIRYYLGLSATKPEFKRFNYAEKAEYWALVWGTIVMAVTGMMLWFKVAVGHLFPRWWLDVATAVHFYEAILATLAIVVWHFYQIVFDPEVYPMNWAWWDGKMSVEHYAAEHGLDRKTIESSIEGAAEKE